MGLLLVAFLVAVGISYLPLIRQNEAMRGEILKLDRQISAKTQEQRQLTATIQQSNDPKAVERLVREKFGYAKPGETVIHFEEGTNALRAP